MMRTSLVGRVLTRRSRQIVGCARGESAGGSRSAPQEAAAGLVVAAAAADMTALSIIIEDKAP